MVAGSGNSVHSPAFTTLRDLLAGTAAGICAKSFSYPLDTVKVRLQSADSKYQGVMHCMTSIGKKEGLRGFYRGVMAPVCGAAIENAFLFGVYANALNWWCHLVGSVEDGQTRADLLMNPPMHGVFVGGAVGGIATAHILTPIELLKCRMQMQNALPKEQRIYKGLIDCAIKSVRNEGITVLYRGHLPMLAREIPGNGAWFLSYEIMRNMLKPANGTKEDIEKWKVAMAGGMAGVLYWTAFFPADVCKTRKQTDPKYQNVSFPRIFAELYRTQGIKGLYTGWGITAVRAFPMNAVIFTVYNAVVESWDEYFHPRHYANKLENQQHAAHTNL